MTANVVHQVSLLRFCELFTVYNRKENFSPFAQAALYEYLWGVARDTDTIVEVDIIGLCCDWDEYSPKELVTEWNNGPDEDLGHVLRYLRMRTTVLTVRSSTSTEDISYLVEAFGS